MSYQTVAIIQTRDKGNRGVGERVVTMMGGGRTLDIIFKIEARGFSDKLDVKHESSRFFSFS